jgi:hypothetical protein
MREASLHPPTSSSHILDPGSRLCVSPPVKSTRSDLASTGGRLHARWLDGCSRPCSMQSLAARWLARQASAYCVRAPQTSSAAQPAASRRAPQGSAPPSSSSQAGRQPPRLRQSAAKPRREGASEASSHPPAAAAWLFALPACCSSLGVASSAAWHLCAACLSEAVKLRLAFA